MPEMPEVENIVIGIKDFIENKKIVDVEIIKGDVIKSPSSDEYRKLLQDKIIKSLKRRGKYIIMSLDDERLNIIHLRMTGKLLYKQENEDIDKYSCVIYHLEDKTKLIYADIRRLGTLDLITTDEISRLKGLYTLGAEPLSSEFTIEYLKDCLDKSKTKIKPFLLNQKNVAGLGNIYVDEALAISKIHPERKANSLNDEEIERLHQAINLVINEGIRDGGTSFRDYRNGLGEKGSHQDKLYVYNRKGKECRFCHTLITKIVLNGRGTYFCPNCQKLNDDK